jgi:ribonuclease HI
MSLTTPEPVDMENKYNEPDEKHGDVYPQATPPPQQQTSHPPPYYVETSTIPGAGYGLKANQRFKKGDKIVAYTGELIDEKEKARRYPNNEGQYVMYVKHDMYIDAANPLLSSAARYINSSGGGYNNTTIKPYHRNGEHIMNIVATRDIAPGEEIFMPYGSSYHMMRAPPTKHSVITPPSHWEQHMYAPKHTKEDGRIQWKVTQKVDWKLFEQSIEPHLTTWMKQYKLWMPPQSQSQRQSQLHRQQPHTMDGTVHACMYTDGASRGNPGAASCGGVIYLAKDKKSMKDVATAPPIHSFNTTIGVATNNEAEYKGLIQGLEAACEMGVTHVSAYVDSELMCKQVKGQYQVKHPTLTPLHTRCTILISQLQQFSITHIKRKYNKEADRLCNVALDSWTTWASDISDFMNSNETGLTEKQKKDISHAYEQLQEEEEESKEEHISQESRPQHITQEDIDRCWKRLHNIIIQTAQSCVGEIKRVPHIKDGWAMSPEIRAAHDKMRHRRRMVRRLRKLVINNNRNDSDEHENRNSITPHQLQRARVEYMEARKDWNTQVWKGKTKEWTKVTAACDTYTDKQKHNIVWKKYKRTKPTTRVAAASFADKEGRPPIDATQALNNMADHIARISSLPRSAMFDEAHEEHVRSYVRDHIPELPCSPHAPSFSFTDVEQTCTSFRLNTSLGSDNISPYFLRYGGKQLHRAVYMLFSMCSWFGVVPTSFRHGHVMTLYKGEGQETDPDSYRPITITSVVARIYERIHKQELLTEIIKRGIPSQDQFGFTKQRSTHDAIYRLLSLIVETSTKGDRRMDIDKRYVPVVFVDISKAYDKVWIDGLLYKLHHDLGIKENLFYMIRAMLTKRTIQVVCDGKISTMHVLEEGVPQGSILAPLLFLIYIHELTQTPANNKSICMSLFADDIAILPLSIGTSGIEALNRALGRMSAYARKWKITFSAKKTNVVYFRPGQRCKQAYTPPHKQDVLKLTSFPIACARSYTYLGVVLDQFLTFIPHVLDLIKRIRKTSYIISRLVRRDHLPSIPVIQSLVKTVLVPHMVYGFAFIPKGLLADQPIQLKRTGIPHTTAQANLHSMLKRAMITPLLRCMGQPYYVHHDSLLVESRLLSIHALRSLSCIRLAHRWMSNNLDATNDAGRMFRDHAISRNIHKAHPFTQIQQAVTDIPTFSTFATAPLAITNLERHTLKGWVWEHEYKRWMNDGTHPLHSQYKHNITPSIRNLPTYMHIDAPGTASNRARLRLARARLRYDQDRLHFDVGPVTCRMCGKARETVKHVLEVCDASMVATIRHKIYGEVVKLCDKKGENIDKVWNALEPNTKHKRVLIKAHELTGKLINKLRDIWDF